MGWKNWALVNRTNTRKDSDDKRMKRKKGCIEEKSSSAKSKEVCSYILLTNPITSLVLECYLVSLFSFFLNPLISLPPSSFILSFLFISTFHLYARWLISTYHKSSCSSCKAEIHCSGITSTLMWPRS